tara:strand:+ start:698 stop:979 length:282 start_codon:yes stop_codon:yes gene_type:complete
LGFGDLIVALTFHTNPSRRQHFVRLPIPAALASVQAFAWLLDATAFGDDNGGLIKFSLEPFTVDLGLIDQTFKGVVAAQGLFSEIPAGVFRAK